MILILLFSHMEDMRSMPAWLLQHPDDDDDDDKNDGIY
jgi:hypothetical protein